jgi:hypothetical protein
MRALAGTAHQPVVRRRRPAGAVGTAPRAASGRAYHGNRHVAGDRAFAVGVHVSPVGLRRLERRDRDFSFAGGVPFARAGSSTRPGRHTAGSFAFDGCSDVLLPGGWLARICRAGGSANGKYSGSGNSCGGGGREGGDSPAAVYWPNSGPGGKADAPSRAGQPPCEAGGVRPSGRRSSEAGSHTSLGKNRVDRAASIYRQASRVPAVSARKGCGETALRSAGTQLPAQDQC